MEATTLEKELEELARESIGAKYIWFDYLNEKLLVTMGLITREQFNNYEEKIRKRIASLPAERPNIGQQGGEGVSVFLSYNENDRELALRIKQELALHNVAVTMYVDEITFKSIEHFIISQVKEKNAVMWLISEDSLKSYWVNYERRIAGFSQLLLDKHFIPVCTTRFFMEDKFYDDAFDELTKQIREYDDKISRYKANGKDPQMLESARKNRSTTQKNLGDILNTLRNELRVLPIGPSDFSTTLKKIAQLLTDLEQQKLSKFKL